MGRKLPSFTLYYYTTPYRGLHVSRVFSGVLLADLFLNVLDVVLDLVETRRKAGDRLLESPTIRVVTVDRLLERFDKITEPSVLIL